MYELTLKRFVHVRHALRLYNGEYEPMHNHRWLVSAQVSASELDQIGAVMDFHRLDRAIATVVDEIDGKTLNEMPEFQARSSSSEYVAKYLFDRLASHLPETVRLDSLSLDRDEAISARFTYRNPAGQ
jgi:6-pyruvoyltetrahydropterin/6-carboxytetrahydropterin synthase